MRLETQGLPGALEKALRDAFDESSTGPDVCVVGTGDLPIVEFLAIEPAQWTLQIEALADACFFAQRVASSALADGREARLIFVSHPAAVRPIVGAGLSAIAGAFLSTIARVAAVELGPKRITANVVVPGWTEDVAGADLTGDIPAGRYATAEELAEVCLFLASPAAAYITGASLVVDGGFTISKGAGSEPFVKHG